MNNQNSVQKSVTAEDVQSDKPADQAAEVSQNITGRAVFAVDTSAAGIVVRTAFLSEQGQVIEMPAVSPDLSYALQQIDHLRQLVVERFAQAAQVGVQVIAAQQGSTSAEAAVQAEPATA